MGHSLDELGHSLSWWEFKVFLRHHEGRYAREVLRRKKIEATPPEQRQVGGESDALTIAEMDEFLGWD